MRRTALGLYALICSLILTLFGWRATAVGDPHLFNRAGATVAAVSALFVLMQVAIENSEGNAAAGQKQLLSKLRREVASESEKIPQAAQRILRTELESLEKILQRARIEMAVVVGLFASLGEVIHGWGDLFIEAISAAGH